MVITELNGTIINTKEVYLHDDILVLMQFDRNSKKLELLFREYGTSKTYTMIFYDVIGFDMTNCDYFGESERILDFSYIEPNERNLIPKLHDKGKNFEFSPLRDYDSYMETLLTFCSCDELRIACKSIEFNK